MKPYTARLAQTTPATTGKGDQSLKKTVLGGLGLLTTCLVVGAVYSASLSIHASYELAQLQQRHQAALKQKQVLQEQLAEATSLRHVEAFAAQRGFTKTAVAQGTLEQSLSVAQR